MIRPTAPITKYIILRDDQGQEHPLIFSGDIQHSAAVPQGGFTPISAGFCMFHDGRVLIPALGSDSLSLDPRPQDKDILATFLS